MWTYMMGGMGWWMLMWWAFGLAVLVLLVVLILRATGSTTVLEGDNAEQVLKRRYARGELSRDEYEQRLNDLRR